MCITVSLRTLKVVPNLSEQIFQGGCLYFPVLLQFLYRPTYSYTCTLNSVVMVEPSRDNNSSSWLDNIEGILVTRGLFIDNYIKVGKLVLHEQSLQEMLRIPKWRNNTTERQSNQSFLKEKLAALMGFKPMTLRFPCKIELSRQLSWLGRILYTNQTKHFKTVMFQRKIGCVGCTCTFTSPQVYVTLLVA